METKTKRMPPCALVIFGAAGDLAKRLLMPAIYNLRCTDLLPEDFLLVCVARRPGDDKEFRNDLRKSIREFAGTAVSESDLEWLAERTYYLHGDFDNPETYARLNEFLENPVQLSRTAGNAIFYLATPAEIFSSLVARLGDMGLVREDGKRWRRIVIEKPFGHDLRSAETLNHNLLSVLSESQIYRIDHYLGKETVQNILVFRFGNGIFEPLWNRHHIDHVQITVAERLGVEERGKFYDATGALRDMVPNHVVQLLTLIAMEPPNSFDAEILRSEKAKVLKAIQPLRPETIEKYVVRGQYGVGAIKGEPMEAYRSSKDVNPVSATETYVAMKLMIDNWRWAGVPFYIRTGKALSVRRTEIAIQFKQAPLTLFRDTPAEHLTPNDLILHIQPEEGVSLHFGAKVPGPSMRMGGVEMNFNYKDHFKGTRKTGYEILIYDCIVGDPTLFQRADNIEAGWKVVQPILDIWSKQDAVGLSAYAAGSAGPDEAAGLLARDGRRWRSLNSI